MGNKKLLTAGEVAAVFDVLTATVYQWKKRGLLPYIRVGRTIRFRVEDVDALLAPKKKLGL